MTVDGIAQAIQTATTWILPVLFAITLHEAAHGWAASKLGDDTARRLGRVSFNPLRHIDPVGTVLLPGLMMLLRVPFVFGWAKPVPVNFARLRHPRRDMVLVAAAGPGINLIMATAAAALFHVVDFMPDLVDEWFAANLRNAVLINIVLAVFNLFPIPPLDGGRIAVGLLPRSLAMPLARVEPYGMALVMGVMFLLPFVLSSLLQISFNPMAMLLGPPVEAILHGIAFLVGLG